MAKEKITLPYIIGEHPDVKGRIVIAFDNTGLNLSNPGHRHYIDVLAKIMITQMYAKANNIDSNNVKY
ncbi:MAG TPA: hypothetical protein DEO70_12070 [Bacteroidales bacterium]|nr:MAG: hypothetical protein A2X11_10060 [Bacteroidetes bacterium GWE2_42_24]OFY25856.1 MAG: hypothetical protein A2X09_09435 [Bacteroidetes bacterium GWF2_43_11]HBZ67564.1 hypothetical protein [Bacteroidales bacterium]